MIALEPGPDLRPPPMLGELQFVFLVLVLAALVTPRLDVRWRLTSWYRDPARNLEVGGVANSLHVAGLAIDVQGFETSFLGKLLGGSGAFGATNLLGVWRAFGPAFQGKNEGDHIHLELDLR